METIKIHVSVELNLSNDTKNFLSNVLASVAAPAPAAPAPAAPAPAAPAPAAPAPAVTIEHVRQALAAKVNNHREQIKEKLNALGAPSVTKLDPSKYSEMLTFLNALS